jgi:uncharacterized protein
MPASTARQLRNVSLVGLGSLGLLTVAAAVFGGWAVKPGWFPQWGRGTAIPAWLIVSAVIFIAAVVSSTVGFAFSAIAGAMILHCVPNGVQAVEIMMIASIGIQAYSVAGLYPSISWRRCAPFMLGGVAALPIGIILLLRLDPRSYILLMGAALVVYGLYMLLRRPHQITGGGTAADMLAGALGGITGPLAAFPGACATIWCGARGWNKVEQRAVYQPYILVLQIAGLAALHFATGYSSINPALLGYALPGLAGAVVGLRIFQAMTDVQFHRALNLALIVSGIALVLK